MMDCKDCLELRYSTIPRGVLECHAVNKVSQQHLDLSWSFGSLLELVNRYVGVLCKLGRSVLGENIRALLPSTLVFLHSAITGGPSRNVEAALMTDDSGSKAIAKTGEVSDTFTPWRSMVEELAEDLGHNWGVHVGETLVILSTCRFLRTWCFGV